MTPHRHFLPMGTAARGARGANLGNPAGQAVEAVDIRACAIGTGFLARIIAVRSYARTSRGFADFSRRVFGAKDLRAKRRGRGKEKTENKTSFRS